MLKPAKAPRRAKKILATSAAHMPSGCWLWVLQASKDSMNWMGAAVSLPLPNAVLQRMR